MIVEMLPEQVQFQLYTSKDMVSDQIFVACVYKLLE